MSKTHPKTLRALGLLMAACLAAMAAPGAAASQPPAGAVAAPGALRDANDLLMFGTNDLVDTCNTYPAKDAVGGNFETWTAWTSQPGAFDRVENNGTESTPELLERRLLEAEGQDWTDIFWVAYQCAKSGGGCVCASIDIFTGRAAFCTACCPSGTYPYCLCDAIYAYASCGCVPY